MQNAGRRRQAEPARRTEPGTALVRYLTQQISVPGKAASILEAAARFYELAPDEQARELPPLYLRLEQYLTEIDPYPRFSLLQLRAHLQEQFPFLRQEASFQTIFAFASQQSVLLCRTLLLSILQRAYAVLGAAADNLLASTRSWVAGVPAEASWPAPFDLAKAPPASDQGWIDLLTRLSQEVYRRLEAQIGETADRIYENSYQEVAASFEPLETFPIVIHLLPEKLLDEQKIRLLNHQQQLEARDRALAETHGELLAARTAALESAVQLQAILNTVGEGILTIDPEGTLLLVNREVERLWDYPRDVLIGRPLSLLMPTFYDAADGRALAISHLLGQRLEAEGRRRDGSVFPLEMNIQETYIGKRLLFTAAVRDITEQKRVKDALVAAKEAAEEMARLKSSFLANMSHEIRTPLAAILGYTSVLADEVSDVHRDFLQIIDENGKRLLNTLNSVLDLARLEAGAFQAHYEPVDANRELQQVVQLLRPLADQKGLYVHLELPAAETHVVSDRDFLSRILQNLIGNAIKFTERGGLSIALTVNAEAFHIRIADTGIGIQPAFRPHLFDEFKQESTGLTRSHEGSGLGLSITKRLVDVLGGQITVESEPNHGSCFTVALPCTPRQPAGSPPAPSPANLIQPAGSGG